MQSKLQQQEEEQQPPNDGLKAIINAKPPLIDEGQHHHQQGQLEDAVLIEETIPTSNNADEYTFKDHKFVEQAGLMAKEDQITLEMKLLDWKFADFEITLSVNTHIHELIQILEEKHGRIGKVILCKDEFREANEMSDEKKTLKYYGIGASCLDETKVPVVICYNFKPIDNGRPDPILLSWMN